MSTRRSVTVTGRRARRVAATATAATASLCRARTGCRCLCLRLRLLAAVGLLGPDALCISTRLALQVLILLTSRSILSFAPRCVTVVSRAVGAAAHLASIVRSTVHLLRNN